MSYLREWTIYSLWSQRIRQKLDQWETNISFSWNIELNALKKCFLEHHSSLGHTRKAMLSKTLFESIPMKIKYSFPIGPKNVKFGNDILLSANWNIEMF